MKTLTKMFLLCWCCILSFSFASDSEECIESDVPQTEQIIVEGKAKPTVVKISDINKESDQEKTDYYNSLEENSAKKEAPILNDDKATSPASFETKAKPVVLKISDINKKVIKQKLITIIH